METTKITSPKIFLAFPFETHALQYNDVSVESDCKMVNEFSSVGITERNDLKMISIFLLKNPNTSALKQRFAMPLL